MGRGKDGTVLGSQVGEHGEEHTPSAQNFSSLLQVSIFPSVCVEKAGCSQVSPEAGI